MTGEVPVNPRRNTKREREEGKRLKLLSRIVAITIKNILGLAAVGMLIIAISFLPSAFQLSSPAKARPAAENAAVPSFAVKKWALIPESSVYVTLGLRKEPVNIRFRPITGEAELGTMDTQNMKTDLQFDINKLDSGSRVRDYLLKRWLNASDHPTASIWLQAVDKWPDNWSNGSSNRVKLNGTLMLKGISKKVEFDSYVKYEAAPSGPMGSKGQPGQLKIKGTARVSSQDFGLVNKTGGLLKMDDQMLITLQLILEERGNVNL